MSAKPWITPPSKRHTCACGQPARMRNLGDWVCDRCLAIEHGTHRLNLRHPVPSLPLRPVTVPLLDAPSIVARAVAAGLISHRLDRRPRKTPSQIYRERRELLRAQGLTARGTPYKAAPLAVPVPEYLRESWTAGHDPEIRAGLKAAFAAGVNAGLAKAGLTVRLTPRRRLLSSDAEIRQLRDAEKHRRKTAKFAAQGLNAQGQPLKKLGINLRLARLGARAKAKVYSLVKQLEANRPSRQSP